LWPVRQFQFFGRGAIQNNKETTQRTHFLS
jgi:hypothetical protein